MTPSPIISVQLSAAGARLSGLLAVPETTPRAMVLALHGGGMRASYFHGPAHPDVSLLTLGSSLGFVVLALDRPGYGASSNALPNGLPLREQAAMTWAAIRSFRSQRGLHVPLFVIGHSFGMKLAFHLAATDDHRELVGIECSGAGVRYNPELSNHPGRVADDDIELSTQERVGLFWGSAGLYPPGTLDRANRPTAPVPAAEVTDSAAWPEIFVSIAANVRVPVQYTVAEQERWWDVRPETLARFRSLLTSSPRVEIRRQIAAGHNVSLGWTARAYHLAAIAFAEECLTTSSRSAC